MYLAFTGAGLRIARLQHNFSVCENLTQIDASVTFFAVHYVGIFDTDASIQAI
jgi:hypothetical protein